MEGAGATTRGGAARSAGSRGSPPMPQASEFASARDRERRARPTIEVGFGGRRVLIFIQT